MRPIGPDDAPVLRAAYAELSPASRLARFGTGSPRLSDAQVRYLTDVDQRDHLAVGAALRDDPGHGLGVARCVRLPDEADIAEAAVTVVDAAQGQGLGTLLLAVLARCARAAGISTFRCYVLNDNERTLGMLERLGAQPAVDETAGLARVDLPVPERDDLVPDAAAARVLRAVSRRRLHPLDRRFPPVFGDAADDEAESVEVRAELRRWLERALQLLPGGGEQRAQGSA